MKKSFLFVVLCLMAFTIFAQAPSKPQTPQADTTHYIYDTTYRTFIWYVSNIITGTSNTCFALRVTKSKMDFVQPTQDDLKRDSLTLKKQKIGIGVMYFIPVIVLDSAATKKAKKQTYKQVYQFLPSELILNDANRNWDFMIPNTVQGTQGTNNTNKK
jgi:hypothetical protein